MENNHARVQKVLGVQLEQVRLAFCAIEAAVSGLDCNDHAAQQGIAASILRHAELGSIIKEMNGKEPEYEQ